MNLRCFISIDIPDQIRREIDVLVGNLKKYDADIKWIPPENLHVTLKFLGSTPENLLPGINDALSAMVSSYEPFCIKIVDTGVFPNQKNPRVCWVGIEDSGRLKALQADVDSAAKLFGFKPEDREFTPHLTIGRVRSRQGMISILNELDRRKGCAFGSFMVDCLRIMKSDLKPKGAEYTCLYEVSFGKK